MRCRAPSFEPATYFAIRARTSATGDAADLGNDVADAHVGADAVARVDACHDGLRLDEPRANPGKGAPPVIAQRGTARGAV